MKKLILILLLMIGAIYLSAYQEKEYRKETSNEELRGVFFSYIEISRYLKGKDEYSSKNNIDEIIQNINEFGLNTLILQVRPSLDSIYESKIFPLSIYLTDDGTYPYNVLDYFIEKCHAKNIKVYAWINPYRISTTAHREDIKPDSPVYPYKDTDIVFENKGLYLNPAREESNKIILSGIKEVLEYKVDGVLFDDYFYPDEEVDIVAYEEYKKKNPNITLEEFHFQNINQMVKQVHELCEKKNVRFGISPEGNLENNYTQNYADVKRWMKEEGYIDFIMPQLYYGFFNTTKPYVETAIEWDNLIEINIKMYPALAFYKVGKEDSYAKSGKREWIESNDIISKEIIHARSLRNYGGFVLYRYDNLFNEEEFTNNSIIEKENVKKVIK